MASRSYENEAVDMSEVNMAVIGLWIRQKVREILHRDDDFVTSFIDSQLDTKFPDRDKLEANLTARFLSAGQSKAFVGELWELLLSAMENIDGVPYQMGGRRKETTEQRKTMLKAMLNRLSSNVLPIPSFANRATQPIGPLDHFQPKQFVPDPYSDSQSRPQSRKNQPASDFEMTYSKPPNRPHPVSCGVVNRFPDGPVSEKEPDSIGHLGRVESKRPLLPDPYSDTQSQSRINQPATDFEIPYMYPPNWPPGGSGASNRFPDQLVSEKETDPIGHLGRVESKRPLLPDPYSDTQSQKQSNKFQPAAVFEIPYMEPPNWPPISSGTSNRFENQLAPEEQLDSIGQSKHYVPDKYPDIQSQPQTTKNQPATELEKPSAKPPNWFLIPIPLESKTKTNDPYSRLPGTISSPEPESFTDRPIESPPTKTSPAEQEESKRVPVPADLMSNLAKMLKKSLEHQVEQVPTEHGRRELLSRIIDEQEKKLLSRTV